MRYLVGTLFQQEQIKQKTQYDNMKAKDDKGHMRWEGAFTGGFTAGYKNTCGSKDGWAPAVFVSSRDKRAEQIKQDISEFMDEDDYGKSKIAENIHVIGGLAEKLSNNPFNITLQESIGEKILNRLKKIKVEEFVPKNEEEVQKLFEKYAQQEIIENNKSTHYYNLRDKNDYASLGTHHHEQIEDEFINEYDQLFNQVVRNKWKEESEEEKKKRVQENRIYTDFTKPIDAEDDYLKQIIQNNPDEKKPHKKIKLEIFKNKIEHLFVKHDKKKQNERKIQVPVVPEDYDPYTKLKNLNKQKQQKLQSFNKKLNIQKRKQALGEATAAQQKMKNQKFVKAQEKLSNMDAKDELVFQLMDPKKQGRYQRYVLEIEGKLISGNDTTMDQKQAEKEREEFDKIYQQSKRRKPTPAEIQRIEKEKPTKPIIEVEKIIRTKSSWRPQKLLCKRFGVLTPYNVDD